MLCFWCIFLWCIDCKKSSFWKLIKIFNIFAKFIGKSLFRMSTHHLILRREHPFHLSRISRRKISRTRFLIFPSNSFSRQNVRIISFLTEFELLYSFRKPIFPSKSYISSKSVVCYKKNQCIPVQYMYRRQFTDL